MKLQEQYKIIKKENKDYLILQKKGIFYMAYEDDAMILNYLFDYQVKDYVIKDEDEIYDYIDNTYQDILYYAKKNYFENLNSRLLLEEIAFLLKNKPENIRKLKDFVNEL